MKTLFRFGWLYVACILAIYVYLAAGPAMQGRVLGQVDHPPILLMQFAGVLGSTVFRTVALFSSLAVMWVAWVWAMARWPLERFHTRRVWLWGGVTALLLLPLPPHFSDDVIGYAQQGRLLEAYKQNPYLHTLSEKDDPWAKERIYWSRQKSPYGPVLTVLHAGAAWAAGPRLAVAVALLKLVMLTCFLLTGWFVQRILERLAPDEAGRGLFFWLCNPMALLEIPGQAHNDAVMIALMMCGLWLTVQEKQVRGFVTLFLSFLTKFTTAILLPLHLALMLRRRAWRSIAIAAGVSLALALGCYTLFFRDPASISGLREVSTLAWLSPTWLGSEVLRRSGWEIESARRVFQLPLTLAFIGFVLWRMTKVLNPKSLLREASFILLFFLLLVNNQMNPWYLTLLLPVAATVRHPVTRTMAMAISLWPLAMYFRPLLYQPPFWANVGRMLLFYSGMAFALWYGLRTTARMPAALPESEPPAH